MTDAVETVWENVDQEPADELARCQAHNLLAAAALDPVVLPFERNGIGIGADQSAVRDCHTVGVAGQVCQHGFGPPKGGFA